MRRIQQLLLQLKKVFYARFQKISNIVFSWSWSWGFSWTWQNDLFLVENRGFET